MASLDPRRIGDPAVDDAVQGRVAAGVLSAGDVFGRCTGDKRERGAAVLQLITPGSGMSIWSAIATETANERRRLFC